MFLSFKHKSNKSAAVGTPVIEKIATKMNTITLRAAVRLQLKSNHVATKTKRIILIAFMLFSTAACVRIIAYSLIRKPTGTYSLTPIRLPPFIIQPSNHSSGKQELNANDELQKIYGYKKYLDSLGDAFTIYNKQKSLFKLRPGLMDTLHLLETTLIKQRNEMPWKRKNIR